METCLSIELSKLTESPTNPRGREGFTGPQFNDFVASIKEKGVLMPVLVRKDKDIPDRYEIIAGARRFRAAKAAGLKVIPARLVEMSDVEVREAQIIENLQRADIHPIEEGIAYRNLIEKSIPMYTIKDVAAKVGKSETYVKQRLGLTNLSPKCVKAFRDGEITPSYAVELARIENTKAQEELLQDVVNGYIDSVEELKEKIRDRVYTDLGNKPWAKDAKLAEILGEKAEETLFGKVANDDPVEYARKMSAYIEIKIREAKEKGQEMVKISTSYGKPDIKEALARDAYKMLSDKKEMKKAKSPIKGIVVEGSDLGRIHWITKDPADMKQSRPEVYRKTPAELKREAVAKKKQEAKERARQRKFVTEFETLAGKLSMADERSADVLLEIAINAVGNSQCADIVDVKGWTIIERKRSLAKGNSDMVEDYEETCRVEGKKLPLKDRMKLAMTIMLMETCQYSDPMKKKITSIVTGKKK